MLSFKRPNLEDMQICFEDLSDSRYEIIANLLNDQRKRKYSLREVINAILWIQRTGIQWRNLDKKYPPWRSVYYYFRKWQTDGTLERLHSELNKIERKRQGKQENPSLLCAERRPIVVSLLSRFSL